MFQFWFVMFMTPTNKHLVSFNILFEWSDVTLSYNLLYEAL